MICDRKSGTKKTKYSRFPLVLENVEKERSFSSQGVMDKSEDFSWVKENLIRK